MKGFTLTIGCNKEIIIDNIRKRIIRHFLKYKSSYYKIDVLEMCSVLQYSYKFGLSLVFQLSAQLSINFSILGITFNKLSTWSNFVTH